MQGLSGASFLEVLRVWSTPKERSRSMGMSISGIIFGIMLGFPVCGTIAYHLDWKAVFYITGNYRSYNPTTHLEQKLILTDFKKEEKK